jgi:hypothetical protein
MVFPVSSVMLDRIDDYRTILQGHSAALVPSIEWRPTPERDVEVLNDTADLYRYCDCTQAAEFLFACVQRTVAEDLPREIDYLRRTTWRCSGSSGSWRMGSRDSWRRLAPRPAPIMRRDIDGPHPRRAPRSVTVGMNGGGRSTERPVSDRRKTRRLRRAGVSHDVDASFVDVEGEKVWGATAMVLAELTAGLE